MRDIALPIGRRVLPGDRIADSAEKEVAARDAVNFFSL